MMLEKLRELEAEKGFDDINIIRGTGTRTFMDEWVATDLLGRGSFGNVYRIVKPQRGVSAQECALKICEFSTPEDGELKRQEIETQKLLAGHPNAVQIEDYSLLHRAPPRVSYLLIRMELLNRLPEEGLSEHETIRLGIDICSVLEKCASLEPKLIHCDIKPANILVSNDGRYKLGDFGTAKTLGATMTYTGNRGTPLYMAPEVASFSGYDSRCDIFSLGYTMLTMLNGGRHPYEDAGDVAEILRCMYGSRKLPQINGVSPGLMKILRKMCEPSLQQRYSRASEVRRDLERFVRKKEEAIRNNRLEAERQSELAVRKTKAELEKYVAEIDKGYAGEFIYDNGLMLAPSKFRDGYIIAGYLDSFGSFGEQPIPSECEGKSIIGVAPGAFKNCSANNIDLPDSVAFIGDRAFEGCKNLKEFNIGDNVKYIRDNPFVGCSALSVVNVSENNGNYKTVGGVLCSADGKILVSVLPGAIGSEVPSDEISYPLIPEETLAIGDCAFSGCSELTDVVVPEGVLLIGDYAFGDCRNLASINIPASVSVIGANPFCNCPSLTSVDLDVDNKSFVYSDGILCSADMTRLISYQFDGSSLTVPDGVVSIDASAFRGMRFSSVSIPDSVKSIGDSAFEDCIRLTEIDLPGSVTEIGNSLFLGCTELRKARISEGLEKFGRSMFEGCTLLSEVSILHSAVEIGERMFYDCRNLRTVDLQGSVGTICERAFENCISLETITLAEGVKYIGPYAFYNCRELKRVEIPESIIYLGSCVFTDCVNLVEVVLPDGMQYIPEHMFSNCSKLNLIELPDSIDTISNYAFSGCVNLTSISLPQTVEKIGIGAFNGCSSLEYIDIPNYVQEISLCTFQDCFALNRIGIPEGVTTIADEAFSGCRQLTDIVLPPSVQNIGKLAFDKCVNLTVTARHDAEFYGINLGDYIEWIVDPNL